METLASSPSLSMPGDSSPWIGGTGLGNTSLGKSGKMIERLMSEVDRLRREITAERTKREELQRAAQTQKSSLETLHAENYRLSNIKSLDDSIIKRRDRKIEELKAELSKHETMERHLERRAEDAERTRDERCQQSERAIQLAVEEAKHATLHSAILATSHTQLRNEYQQRLATLNSTVKDLRIREEENERKLGKLDVVNNKMRQESERTRKVNTELVECWKVFNEEKEAEMESLQSEVATLREAAAQRELQADQKMSDMQGLMHEMKWLMAFQKVTDGGIEQRM